jgi:hypothetical protein
MPKRNAGLTRLRIGRGIETQFRVFDGRPSVSSRPGTWLPVALDLSGGDGCSPTLRSRSGGAVPARRLCKLEQGGNSQLSTLNSQMASNPPPDKARFKKLDLLSLPVRSYLAIDES